MKVLSLFDGMACGMIAMQLAGIDVDCTPCILKWLKQPAE